MHCRLSYSLSELDLSNNSGITGMLPPQLGLLPRLQAVKVTTTHMSCAGIIKPFVSCSEAAAAAAMLLTVRLRH